MRLETLPISIEFRDRDSRYEPVDLLERAAERLDLLDVGVEDVLEIGTERLLRLLHPLYFTEELGADRTRLRGGVIAGLARRVSWSCDDAPALLRVPPRIGQRKPRQIELLA